MALKKAWEGRAFSHSEGFRKHAPLQPDGVEALAPEQAGNLVDVVDMQTVRDVVLAVRAVCVCVRAKGASGECQDAGPGGLAGARGGSCAYTS